MEAIRVADQQKPGHRLIQTSLMMIRRDQPPFPQKPSPLESCSFLTCRDFDSQKQLVLFSCFSIHQNLPLMLYYYVDVEECQLQRSLHSPSLRILKLAFSQCTLQQHNLYVPSNKKQSTVIKILHHCYLNKKLLTNLHAR